MVLFGMTIHTTFKGAAIRIAPQGPAVKTVGALRVKGTAGTEPFPGITTHTYGKGRVILG